MHGTDLDSLTTASKEQISLPFVLMRGGTSKAVFLRSDTLPPDGERRDTLILSLFGSPDPRQIDGLGGADLLTSKLAIIDAPSRPDADLDYTFAQVSITEPVVDYDINCGNISAAVGAYAIDEGLVPAEEPVTTVRIHNTNTGRILLAKVPIVDGTAGVEGTYAVHGVPGTGAPISLDFAQTAGGITGSLLPTGNETDVLDTDIGPIEATIIDLANLTVFFRAESVGMSGTEGPDRFTEEHLRSVAAVKAAASQLLGMPTDGLTPVPAIVSPPASYISFATGHEVASDDVDLVARVVGGRPAVLHKAYPGTLSACTGVAARIVGTTVNAVTRADRRVTDQIIIGHTSGVMPVLASVSREGGSWVVEEATYQRTARRLAEGTAYVRAGAFTSRNSAQ
ncbi:MAG: PrpF domain-containing protein [Acidimicrobiia bacterium]